MEFQTTFTELKDMAATPIIGCSRQKAAKGIAIAL
jgi:L-arabinose isomerase